MEGDDFLKKHKTSDFNLSEGLKKNTYLYQRSIEFNYPIKINEASQLILFLNDEDIPVTCAVIEIGEYLKLTQC